MRELPQAENKAYEFTVPFVGPSTNSIYGGVHWTKRSAQKKQARTAMLAAVGDLRHFAFPVDIEATPMLGKGARAYDTSNYSYSYKLIEDAMIKCGILAGDSIEHVRRVIFNPPVRIGGKYSHTLIKIYPAKE